RTTNETFVVPWESRPCRGLRDGISVLPNEEDDMGAETSKANGGLAGLALHGGPKAVPGFTGRGRPKIGADEFLALADLWGYSRKTQAALRRIVERERDLPSPHLTRYYNPRPSRVAALEAYARKLFGVKHALAVNCGTAALNCAYIACGIGPGDEVIVPAFTFLATATAVITAKALPVIAEVDDSLTLDPDDAERKITPRTKAIAAVHMAGHCCDMARILRLARKHKLLVIEDTAQACGGRYHGQLLGTIGDVGCFSISSFKITGGGEGGMVLTDDEWLYTRAQNQHDTGGCWRPDRYAKERRPGELFVGENYRMSELDGAVNLVQLRKTDAQARRYNANYRRVLGKLDKGSAVGVRRSNDPRGDVGYNLVLFAKDPATAARIIPALGAEGVGCHGRGTSQPRDWHIAAYWEQIIEHKSASREGCPFTCPYRKEPLPAYSEDMCPRTRELLDRAISIGISQWWNAADCARVAQAINKVCRALG
ncbi:MAG: aminotransferase class V-fold PLP-dependent enzyme, partial [Planctomycetota bacterium]|nr:aminotransferase class V-fold PLP-dependent enzyme [Planctomycetota bacterium]